MEGVVSLQKKKKKRVREENGAGFRHGWEWETDLDDDLVLLAKQLLSVILLNRHGDPPILRGRRPRWIDGQVVLPVGRHKLAGEQESGQVVLVHERRRAAQRET